MKGPPAGRRSRHRSRSRAPGSMTSRAPRPGPAGRRRVRPRCRGPARIPRTRPSGPPGLRRRGRRDPPQMF